jgi:hypothetical protein
MSLSNWPMAAACLCLACATPQDRTPHADSSGTLSVSAPAPVVAAVPETAPSPDTSTFSLHVFVGMTTASHHGPPELLLRDDIGRMVGYDFGSQRFCSDIPGAGYDSTAEHDDPGAKAATQSAFVSDRTITMAPDAGHTYALFVWSRRPNAYDLAVDLDRRLGPGSAHREARDVAVDSGAVHRYRIHVGDGSLELNRVAEAPER